MKVIDLLNKIANGEEVPKRIRYQLFELDRTYSADIKTYYVDKDGMFFFKDYSYMLNDEVEIIEEDKKIEEIDMFDYFTGYDYGRTNKKLLTDLEYNFVKLNSKINEIIDYINKEK